MYGILDSATHKNVQADDKLQRVTVELLRSLLSRKAFLECNPRQDNMAHPRWTSVLIPGLIGNLRRTIYRGTIQNWQDSLWLGLSASSFDLAEQSASNSKSCCAY